MLYFIIIIIAVICYCCSCIETCSNDFQCFRFCFFSFKFQILTVLCRLLVLAIFIFAFNSVILAQALFVKFTFILNNNKLKTKTLDSLTMYYNNSKNSNVPNKKKIKKKNKKKIMFVWSQQIKRNKKKKQNEIEFIHTVRVWSSMPNKLIIF